LDADAIRANGPAGFRLPPVVYHGDVEIAGGPPQGVGITALAREKERSEIREVIFLLELESGVFSLYASKRGGRGEQGFHFVLRNHSPECAGVRRAHGLAFVKHGSVSVEQRSVN